MLRYAYIDESGTKDDQEVMTVTLILLEGSFSDQSIHREIVKKLHPKYFANRRTKRKIDVRLHYTEMDKEQKLVTGAILAQQSINCYASCFYHEGNEKLHEERFEIYTRLVKSCLGQCFVYFDNLLVTIEMQGGASKYKSALVSSLNEVVVVANSRDRFCKAKFLLKSSAKAGLQLSDFYAGAIRDFLLAHKDRSLADPYELIKHQIEHIQIESLESEIGRASCRERV